MKNRMSRLIDILQDNEAAIIYTSVNRRYLTNFSSSLGYLLICKKRQSLLVDGRYYEAAQKSAENVQVYLLKDTTAQIKDFVVTNGIERILVEDEISLGIAGLFEKSCGCKIEATRLSKFLLDMRSIKSEAELEYIIEAQRIAEKALQELLNFIKPGVSEKRLVAELEYKMKLYGADGPSFDTIAVSGEKSSLPHGVPGDRCVNKGEFITFDFGALVCGYHSDMTRTVAVGYADEQMKEVYSIVLAAELAGEQAAFKGKRCADVDMAARTIISDAGYGHYFAHSTGHGVGLQIHEKPNLSAKSDEWLEVGSLITCEPGIYLPGKFGVRTEDMLYIRENGPQNLTKFEKQLIIV